MYDEHNCVWKLISHSCRDIYNYLSYIYCYEILDVSLQSERAQRSGRYGENRFKLCEQI